MLASRDSEKTEEKQTINVWIQAIADSSEDKMFQKVIADYNAEHSEEYQVVLQNITKSRANSCYIDKLNAALTIASIPVIIIYSIFQNYIVEGSVRTGIK